MDAQEIRFALKSQVVDKMTAKAEDYEAKIAQLNVQVESLNAQGQEAEEAKELINTLEAKIDGIQ